MCVVCTVCDDKEDWSTITLIQRGSHSNHMYCVHRNCNYDDRMDMHLDFLIFENYASGNGAD